VYNLGNNNFIGRLEVLQRTDHQLEIVATDETHGTKWITALTLGYERKIFTKNNLNTYLGGTFTQGFLPGPWAPAYGTKTPRSAKVFLRFGWSGTKPLKK
ncbi:MAG: hypothetical protein ABL958_14940, partial [Bdellovibrionia bacterium]